MKAQTPAFKKIVELITRGGYMPDITETVNQVVLFYSNCEPVLLGERGIEDSLSRLDTSLFLTNGLMAPLNQILNKENDLEAIEKSLRLLANLTNLTFHRKQWNEMFVFYALRYNWAVRNNLSLKVNEDQHQASPDEELIIKDSRGVTFDFISDIFDYLETMEEGGQGLEPLEEVN